jgi:hypothetical protein
MTTAAVATTCTAQFWALVWGVAVWRYLTCSAELKRFVGAMAKLIARTATAMLSHHFKLIRHRHPPAVSVEPLPAGRVIAVYRH